MRFVRRKQKSKCPPARRTNVADMCSDASKIDANWKARKSVTTDPQRPIV